MKTNLHIQISLFYLIIFFSTYKINAQVPNPVSFNTAVDASLSGTIPLGNNDLSWTASTVSINGPYVPAVRGTNQTAWLTSPYNTANWITFPHNCTNEPVDQTCIGALDEYYRLVFTLPATACNNSVNISGGYCLTMNYFADNCVHEIFVNGVSSFTNPSSSYFAAGFTPTGGQTVTICNNWQPGTNTLVVHIKSSPPTVGFLAFITATATTPGGFTVNTTQNNVSCFNAANGSATVSLNGYSGPASYTWLPGGANTNTISNLSPGIYTVNIQLPLCDLNNTISVTQPSSFAVNVSTTQPICKGAKVTFTATGGETYSWSPGSLSGPVVTLTPANSAVYTVTASDASGCKSSKTFTLQVIPCIGITENGQNEVQILNTISGNLIIVTEPDKEYKVEIFDLHGNLKHSASILRQTEIDVSDLSSGIYVLRLSTTNSSFRKRIILSK